MSDPVLEVRDLQVDIATPRGPLHAVRDISFDVLPGETVCLVGESGCGKSMTALSLMGLLPKTATARAGADRASTARICSSPAASRSTRLRGDRMAMIFQEPMTALNPAWTIGDAAHRGSPPAQAIELPGGARACGRTAGEGRHRARGGAPRASIRISCRAACASG